MSLAWTWFIAFPAGVVLVGAVRRRPVPRFSWLMLLAYVCVIALLSWLGLRVVAEAAGTRAMVKELPVVALFVVACQLLWFWWSAAFEWLRAIGPRIARPLYVTMTVLLLAPSFVAFVLTYRCKWADRDDPLKALGLPFDEASITTRDGILLDAWFVPDRAASSTIVICHGAGSSKGDALSLVRPLARGGHNLLLFDFRGHGASEGRAVTWGIHEQRDVQAVVDWLKRHHPEQARHVIGLGSSQGAVALLGAGAQDPRIEVFILDSPFLSLRALGSDHLKAGAIGRLAVDYTLAAMSAWTGVDFLDASALAYVPRLGARPMLVMRGELDQLVPATHAHALLSAAHGSSDLWEGPSDHGRLAAADPDAYAARVLGFIAKHR